MRLTSLFSFLAVVVAAKATTTTTTEPSAVDTIVKALKQGDVVGAAIDLFTLGSCDIANDAGNYLFYPRAITTQLSYL
jgi:hypothetical protein